MSDTKYYPKDTAGRLLTQEIPVYKEDTKINEVKKDFLSTVKEYATINYIYVVDSHKKLLGVVSMKNLFNTPEKDLNNPVKSLTEGQTLISVHPHTNQEKAAQLAIKYNIKSIPVVNKKGKLLGIINSDHILSIMYEEKVEDLLKFAGVSKGKENLDDFLSMPLINSLKHRIPWIIIGLVGGLLISQLITLFEETLRSGVIIAAFIPLMVYMSNAVGQQITALLIRDSALDE
ncbi:MAG: CBS domain-containing protein, partial [bacterium]